MKPRLLDLFCCAGGAARGYADAGFEVVGVDRDPQPNCYFETNWPLVGKPCNHGWQTPRFRSLDNSMVQKGRLASVVGVHGHINYPGEFALRQKAMGIDWMTNDELVEAIPPAYTRFIGHQLRRWVEG